MTGIGDDAAVLNVPAGRQLVTTVDTLIAGVHFPAGTAPYDIGYKSLAVNLSDLASMGAEPAWITLAITLPENNAEWLEAFSKGLFEMANRFGVALIGGDTTRGDLSITIQATGFVDTGKAILRSGAQPDDLLYVTGTLGDAWLGLQVVLQNIDLADTDRDFVLSRLNRPMPRISTGLALSGLATSMIDISDGLLADLGHILEMSHVAAELELAHMPLSSAARQYLQHGGDLIRLLSGGDDYELCFTLPATQQQAVQALAAQCDCQMTCIGKITPGQGIVAIEQDARQPLDANGYQHFE